MKLRKEKYNYFDAFVQMSAFAKQEAQLLFDTLSNYDVEKLKDVRHQMHQLEHECDEVKHTLTTALVKDFLPPVDREDLFTLSHVTDELTDKVESVLNFLYMANVTKLRDDTLSFVQLMISCCDGVSRLLQEFRNFRHPAKLLEIIIEINDLEEQGDRVYMDAVHNLSVSEQDTRTIIEWRDVYHTFENVFDCAEKIADCVESVIMKIA